MAMNFTDTDIKTLLTLWNNSKSGLDKVAKTLDDGTFHTPREKGAAPPSQAGQTILWFAMAIDAELTRRKVKH